jgi:anti-sigma factor RsiW
LKPQSFKQQKEAKMRCSKARKLISPYIDGELTESEKREFEAHLRVCKGCWSEIEETHGLHQLFENTEIFSAPFGFHSRVMANVNAKKPGWSPMIPVRVRLLEAVMVLLLIVVGAISGSFLGKGLLPERAGNGLTASLHLDVFNSAPPGTLGGAYLAMTEVKDEK